MVVLAFLLIKERFCSSKSRSLHLASDQATNEEPNSLLVRIMARLNQWLGKSDLPSISINSKPSVGILWKIAFCY